MGAVSIPFRLRDQRNRKRETINAIEQTQSPRTPPLSNLLPMMSEDELKKLRADILEVGLEEPIMPIMLFEGNILDGRDRYQACQDVGIEPRSTACSIPSQVVRSPWMNCCRSFRTPGRQPNSDVHDVAVPPSLTDHGAWSYLLL